MDDSNATPAPVVETVAETPPEMPVHENQKSDLDISRQEAARRAVKIFGDRAFARKKTKTTPGHRRQIGLRATVPPFRVVVVGSGNTWREATKAAVDYFEKNGASDD